MTSLLAVGDISQLELERIDARPDHDAVLCCFRRLACLSEVQKFLDNIWYGLDRLTLVAPSDSMSWIRWHAYTSTYLCARHSSLCGT